MAELPLRRLVVYVAVGLVVFGVGVWGLLSTRVSGAGTAAVIQQPGGSDTGAEMNDAETGGLGGSADALASGPVPGGSTGTTARQVYVQILGAVRNPGVYALPLGSRVFAAVEAAGGLRPEADDEAVPLAATVADGGRIVVPVKGAVTTAPGGPSLPGGTAGQAGATTGPISLSTATVEDLDRLPGIGPAIAGRIVSYRETNGPFSSVDELEEVPGIGPALLERLRDLVVP